MKAGTGLLISVLLAGCTRHQHPPAPPSATSSIGSIAPLPAPARGAHSLATPSPRLGSGISGTSRSGVVAASQTPPQSSIANHDGLRGLLAALDEVNRIELLRWDRRGPAEPLSVGDQSHLLKLMRGGQLIEAHTVAHPPWPAAFVFYTQKHGTYAATLVGRSNLRLDAGRSDGQFEGDAAQWNHSPPPEMVLDDGGWLWKYFEARLGATKEKEYLAPKAAPDYLELPQKP